MRSTVTSLTFMVALLGASACGSDVDLPTGAGTTGSGAGSATSGAGTGSSTGSAITSTGSTGAGAGSGSTGSTGAGAGSGSTGSTGSSGSTGAGTGSSSASSGSSGGTPPSKVCSDCAQLAIEGPCKAAFDACNDSFACKHLLDCHSKCEWTDMCNADCDAIIPSGVPLLSDLMACIACEQCVLPCAGSTLVIYCP